MRNLLTIITLLLVNIQGIYCQQKEDTLSESGKVYLNLKNINFIKDNEFNHPIIKGYTLIGYFIQPAIIYLPSKNVTLKLGIHLLNYAGANKINQAKLVFSTTYKFSENTFLTFGTLNGSDKHRMLDPHFNSERLYNSYAEDGIQFVTKNEHVFNDTWISWENFILKGDTTREIFTFGESFRYASAKIAGKFIVEVPIQLQFKHYGGQIRNNTEKIETYFNLASGVRINYDIAGKRLGVAGLEYLQFINRELQTWTNDPFTRGYASWIRFHYNYKAFYFGSYYWKSHNFFAPNGNAIYGSISTVKDYLVISDRTIWTNSLCLNIHPINCLEIYTGLDIYYDLNLKHMDAAIAVHLNFEKLIKIATLGR